MKTKHAIDMAGSATALARLLGITSAAVAQWGEDLPDKRMWQLRVLRPEWFREQKGTKARPASEGAKA